MLARDARAGRKDGGEICPRRELRQNGGLIIAEETSAVEFPVFMGQILDKTGILLANSLDRCFSVYLPSYSLSFISANHSFPKQNPTSQTE